MTTMPDDPIDAGEARLARRVRDYTEPAVVPTDHGAVARAAAGGGGPRRTGTGRFGWLVAGAAAVAGLAALAVLMNSGRVPQVGASPGASTVATGACSVDVLKATAGGWEGAAGHRIGTVTVTNTGGAACILSGALQPSLIDRNGNALIIGKAVSGPPIEIRPGFTVVALVQTGNYCGPTAQEPAAVVLQLASGGRLLAKPIGGDESSGVPPCMGEAGPTDDITIQPWTATMQG